MKIKFQLLEICKVSIFYTPRKRQKTKGFVTFSEGIEIDILHISSKIYKSSINPFQDNVSFYHP